MDFPCDWYKITFHYYDSRIVGLLVIILFHSLIDGLWVIVTTSLQTPNNSFTMLLFTKQQ